MARNMIMSEIPAGSAPLPPAFLRRADAAAYVEQRFGFPCSRQWLAKLAVVGGGPVYRKAGRTPIYAPDDLDRWALARIGAPQWSTSETAAARPRQLALSEE